MTFSYIVLSDSTLDTLQSFTSIDGWERKRKGGGERGDRQGKGEKRREGEKKGNERRRKEKRERRREERNGAERRGKKHLQRSSKT